MLVSITLGVIGAALYCALLYPEKVFFSVEYIQYIPIFIFGIFFGYLFSHNNARGFFFEAKTHLLKALAGSIAHDTKAPIANISLAQALIDDHLKKDNYHNPTVLKMIEAIKYSANNALTVINVLLENIRTQKINTSSFKPININQAIDNTLTLYPFWDKQREQISVEIEQDFDFLGSAVLFQYVLFNLLKNALYHQGDSITITAVSNKTDNVLFFKDTGGGIDPDKIGRIFDDFMTTSKTEGTGLGLPFCKRVMHAFGGDITCHSTKSEYAEFRLSFPKKPTTEPHIRE